MQHMIIPSQRKCRCLIGITYFLALIRVELVPGCPGVPWTCWRPVPRRSLLSMPIFSSWLYNAHQRK